MISLTSELAGVSLSNPILMASGTFGFGRAYSALYPLSKLGGIVTKGLTLHPRLGNTGTRIYETSSGLMNSIGLENPGLAAFFKDELGEMTRQGPAVIVNLGGSTIEEYEAGALFIEYTCREWRDNGERAIDLIELNISCPNVKEGGLQFGIEIERAREVVRAVRLATNIPILVKLSPAAHDIVGMARMCEAEGADGLSLVNTFQAMAIDIKRRKSVFDNLYAGLSGPAIKPIALRMVHQVSRAVKIPVVGIGGIARAIDVLEFIMAGAAVVQIGTYNFMNIRAGDTLADELRQLMADENIGSLEEIRGIL